MTLIGSFFRTDGIIGRSPVCGSRVKALHSYERMTTSLSANLARMSTRGYLFVLYAFTGRRERERQGSDGLVRRILC
jgi:hypothetical protein